LLALSHPDRAGDHDLFLWATAVFEYVARELGLVNYSRELFVEGKADAYLVYEHDRASHEHARERHERLLEARQAAARELEESYAKALAL